MFILVKTKSKRKTLANKASFMGDLQQQKRGDERSTTERTQQILYSAHMSLKGCGGLNDVLYKSWAFDSLVPQSVLFGQD